MRLFYLFLMTFFSIASFSQNEKLIWSDEFNGKGPPDTTKWAYELGASGWGNNELQEYTNELENASQVDSLLVVKAIKRDGHWTSARLVTKGKFNFEYGRIIFKAKLPSGSGTWPALWMLGNNAEQVGWPECGEIDVMEHIGRRPGIVQAAMHTPSSHGNTTNIGYTSVQDYNSEFHLYEAFWTPEKIEFSVDDKIFYTYSPAIKDNETWPYDHPFYIIINIAMGGNFGSDPKFESNDLKNGIDPSLMDATMEVDYVRVYQVMGK
ncbi:MAG TPA: glycoside hydrolase family 16 protein [Lentimicrobium sp.]|nr:glycoside hydrolase family 16 protein [Lentimicrobium sp.]